MGGWTSKKNDKKKTEEGVEEKEEVLAKLRRQISNPIVFKKYG